MLTPMRHIEMPAFASWLMNSTFFSLQNNLSNLIFLHRELNLFYGDKGLGSIFALFSAQKKMLSHHDLVSFLRRC